MVDWQRVTNFEESAGNSFGRNLLSGRVGARRGGRYDGEGGDEGGWVQPWGLESAMHHGGCGPWKAAVSLNVG